MNEIRKRMISFGAVYYFVTLIFSHEIVLFSAEGVVEKTNQILTLLFLYFLPIFYCLSYIFVEKAKKRYCEKNGYYRIQIPDNNALSIAKQYSVFDCLKLIIKYILLCTLGIFIYKNVSFVNENLMDFLSQVHEQMWLKDFLVLAVTVYAAFFALFQIQVSFLDNGCMFFDTYDLPDVIKSNKLMKFSLIILIIYICMGCTDIDLMPYLLGAVLLLWGVLIAFNVLMYVQAFTSPIILERKVIKWIDRIYGNKKICITPNKIWNKGWTIRQIMTLLKAYDKKLKRIQIDNIEDVDFGCILSRKKRNENLAIKGYYRIVGIVLGIVMLCGFSMSKCLGATPNRTIYMILLFLAAMPILFPFFNRRIIVDNYFGVNYMGYDSIWGYYIKLFSKKENIYVTSYGYSCSQYGKWIIRLKRIACFYNLALNMKYNDIESIDILGVQCLCDYITDRLRTNTYRKGLAIPMLICACLSDDKKIDESTIKKMLKRIDMDKEEKKVTIKMCLLVLRDLYANDEMFYESRYEKKLIGWFE